LLYFLAPYNIYAGMGAGYPGENKDKVIHIAGSTLFNLTRFHVIPMQEFYSARNYRFIKQNR